MRFLPNGPDIPDGLVLEQECGSAVFVCGAGVSMTAGLPSFRSLVEGVYSALGEDWQPHLAEREVMAPGGRLAGQYDRVLRCLERRLAAHDVRQANGMASSENPEDAAIRFARCRSSTSLGHSYSWTLPLVGISFRSLRT